MKKVCLVPLFGDYDDLKTYPHSDGWDYYVVTDRARNHPLYKDIIVKPLFNDKLSTGMVVTQPHLYAKADIFCVMGAQTEYKKHLDLLIPRVDMMLLKHPQKTCTYQEAFACVFLGKGDPKAIAAQMIEYNRQGFPANAGMVATGITVRHNTRNVRRFGEMWFKQILTYSERDQLSFNYTNWKYPELIQHEIRDAWGDIVWHPHKHKP